MRKRHQPHPPRPTDADADLAGTTPAGLTRRRFLTTAALTGGGALLAGCTVPLLARSDDASPTTTANRSTGSTTTSTAAAATPAGLTTGEDIFGDVTSDDLTITVADGTRTIVTASYPDWGIDPSFRYPGTPKRQQLTFAVTTDPKVASSPTQVVTGQVFGVHRNGVVFDPTTAGYYGGQRNGGWNENALAEHLDAHGAHTRPQDGFYHLHLVTDAWVSDPSAHSAFVGWAADGFPIYLRYGYADPTDPTSGVRNLQPSYRLKSGSRPSGSSSPGGTYDGTYVADYEYVDGLGDLDQCNGRWCVTPEYPQGTYAYFLTDAWPSVPHWIRGTPDATFAPGYGGGSGPMSGPPR